jgi:hypothetical protein
VGRQPVRARAEIRAQGSFALRMDREHDGAAEKFDTRDRS